MSLISSTTPRINRLTPPKQAQRLTRFALFPVKTNIKMSKPKKKLHIDIETVSTDFGKPGQTMIAAYRVGDGPIEVMELYPAQPGTDIHRFAEKYLKEGYGIRESIDKAFEKAKANKFSRVTPTSLDNRWLTCPGSNAMTEAQLNEKYKDQK